MRKKRELIFLLIIIVVFIGINYNRLDSFVIKTLDNREVVSIERVVDGDTVYVNGVSVRMLGINTPERGEKFYAEAKNYTSKMFFNKTVVIERKGKDKYGRELAYFFDVDGAGGENLNSKIVEAGYANYYFPEGKDNYFGIFKDAWLKCINNNVNLCKKSSGKCAECVSVVEFGADEDLVLYNSCGFDCNLGGWSVKDEGRKKYIFYSGFILRNNEKVTLTANDFNESYVWTDKGDTLFLRDDKGELVLWEGY